MPFIDCPFCSIDRSRVHLESDSAFAIFDAYPITDGHTLVIPKRHVASIFDLSDQELTAVWSLLAQVRAKLRSGLDPDGFNIGINDGSAAGQTIMHAHVHVIPRRDGDVAEPRGGIRWIFPDKAPYWDEGKK